MSAKDFERVPPLSGRLWLLGALTVVLVPHLLRLPPWLIPFCAALLAWRAGVELKRWPLPPRLLRLVLTVAGIGAVLVAYRTLLGRDAGLALLTVMLCLKLLELRTVRDGMLVMLLGYFLVAGGFLYSQSLPVGVYLFAVVLLLTAALFALNHPGGTQQNARDYLRGAAALLLQAAPIMVALFVLFPRLPGPLWGLPKDAFAGLTGLSDHMTLGNISELADSEEVALRVQFDGPVPPADRLYFRALVLWNTDGRQWTRLASGEFRGRPPPLDVLNPASRVRYTVTLEPHNQRWLFAIDLPTSVPPQAFATPEFQLFRRSELTTRLRYTLESALDYRTGDEPAGWLTLGLRLPGNRNPQALTLGRQWRASIADPAARVDAALALFRDQPFWYSRRPPLLLSDDPVDEFLFDTRRGFCEHYAAAFVTLMRAAGIPARVVTGYQGGEVNPLGGYLIVRQSRAHAWAEVWLQGRGWVRIDPTAAIPPSRIESDTDVQRFRSTVLTGPDIELGWAARWWGRARYGWDALNNGWNQWVLGYDHQRQQQLWARLGLERFGWRGAVALLFGTLALVVGGVGAYLLWRRPPAEEPARRLYRRVEQRLAHLGLARAPNEGPRAYTARVAAARPDLAAELELITASYTALRYRSAPAPQWLPQLRRAVRRFHPRRRR